MKMLLIFISSLCISVVINASAAAKLSIDEVMFSSAHRVDIVRELADDLPFPDYLLSKYVGSDTTSFFAASLTMTSGIVAVGSPGYNTFKGKVDIYQVVDLVTWSKLQTINAPAVIETLGSYQYGFGSAVSLHGTRLVVTSELYDDFVGQLHIYTRLESDAAAWSLAQTIDGPFGRGSGFGYSVAQTDSHIAVGCESSDSVAIYALDSLSEKWTLQQIITPAFSTGDDSKFGFSLAMSAELNYLVVGAHRADDNRGMVFVYGLDAAVDNWDLIDSLSSVDGDNSYFGFAVAISNKTIGVGAPGFMPSRYEMPSSSVVNFNGSVYTYEFSPNTETFELQNTIPSVAGEFGEFGYSVALDDNRMLVGAPGYDNGAGIAYIYQRVGESGAVHWNLNFTLLSDAAEATMGVTVTTAGMYFAAGAQNEGDMVGAIKLGYHGGHAMPSAVPSQLPTLAPLVSTATQYPTLKPTFAPTAVPNFAPVAPPTSQPSSQPSSQPTQMPVASQAPAAAQNVNNILSSGSRFQIPIIAALALGFIILLALTSCFVYCCCCLGGAVAGEDDDDDEAILKKKKEDEDLSDFYVASYRGEKDDLKDADPELLTRLSCIVSNVDDDDDDTQVGAFAARPSQDAAVAKKKNTPSPAVPTSRPDSNKAHSRAAVHRADYKTAPPPVSSVVFADDDDDSDDDINIKKDFAPGAFKSASTAAPSNAKKG